MGTTFNTPKPYLSYSWWCLLVGFRSESYNRIALAFYKLIDIINCKLRKVVHLLRGWVESYGGGKVNAR